MVIQKSISTSTVCMKFICSVLGSHFPDVQFYANGQCGLPWVKGQQGDWCYLELVQTRYGEVELSPAVPPPCMSGGPLPIYLL